MTTEPTTELRRTTAEDWQLLRDVRLRALADAPTAFSSVLDDARLLTEDEWRARAAGTGPTLVVLEEGRGVAMGGVLAPPEGASLFVWGMWTDPAARVRGHAARILDALLAWSRDRAGCAEVLLHVTEGNAGARRLYTSRGFGPTGAWEPLRDDSPIRVEEMRLTLGTCSGQAPDHR